MSVNAFFHGRDNVVSAGRFFVDLTARLEDGELNADEDVMRLARSLGIAIPSELADASIVSLGNAKVAEPGTEPALNALRRESSSTTRPCPIHVRQGRAKLRRNSKSAFGHVLPSGVPQFAGKSVWRSTSAFRASAAASQQRYLCSSSVL